MELLFDPSLRVLNSYYLVQVYFFYWPFFDPQLRPDNNLHLDQIITIKHGHFVFCWLKCDVIPIFIVLFQHQPNLPTQGHPQNELSHFAAKHRFIKTCFVATPLLTNNLCFLTCLLETKKCSCWLNKKHNIESGKNKDKKKGFERESKTGNQKKEKGLMETNFLIHYFDVVLSWNKSN